MCRLFLCLLIAGVTRSAVAGCAAEHCTEIQLAIVECGKVVISPELQALYRESVSESTTADEAKRRAEHSGVLVEGVVVASRSIACPQLGSRPKGPWTPSDRPEQRRYFFPGSPESACSSFPSHKTVTTVVSLACCDTFGSLVVPCAYGLDVLEKPQSSK
jgi:hypothetical protein